MCGACGRSVVGDPVLGSLRTLRQHLIVAQTVNGASQAWPGAPKVAATRDGWLVSGPTGATEAALTVQEVWAAVLRGSRGAGFPKVAAAPDSPGAPKAPPDRAAGPDRTAGGPDTGDLSRRVLSLGRRMAREGLKVSATETGT